MPGQTTALVDANHYDLDPVADEKLTAAYWALQSAYYYLQGADGSHAFAQYRRALEWADKWENVTNDTTENLAISR